MLRWEVQGLLVGWDEYPVHGSDGCGYCHRKWVADMRAKCWYTPTQRKLDTTNSAYFPLKKGSGHTRQAASVGPPWSIKTFKMFIITSRTITVTRTWTLVSKYGLRPNQTVAMRSNNSHKGSQFFDSLKYPSFDCDKIWSIGVTMWYAKHSCSSVIACLCDFSWNIEGQN